MVGNQMSLGFLIASRVHEGYVIAPDSFATSMDWLLERSVGRGMSGITFGQCAFTDLDFADEISLLAELLGLLVPAVEIFQELHHLVWKCTGKKNNGSSTGLLSRRAFMSTHLWARCPTCGIICLPRSYDSLVL